MKKKIIIFLLSLHLFILFMGTSLFDFGHVPVLLQQPIGYYLSLTGGHNYSFFSPDIPTQSIVKCDITYRSGETRTVAIDRTRTTFGLRSVYLFQLLSDNHDYETIARIMARYCIAQAHGNIRSVRIRVGEYKVPRIEQYKAGARSTFSELYAENFINE